MLQPLAGLSGGKIDINVFTLSTGSEDFVMW